MCILKVYCTVPIEYKICFLPIPHTILFGWMARSNMERDRERERPLRELKIVHY